MRKLFNFLVVLCVVYLLMKPDHYEAIRHEFYQVWDSMKGANNYDEQN